MRLILLVCVMLATPLLTRAQFRYFGPANHGSTKTTPKWGIPYDDGGFQAAKPKTIAKGMRRLGLLNAREQDVNYYLSYPEADIASWIDDAYDRALVVFTDCGGALADSARLVNPAGYFVVVEPTIWTTPASPTGWAAGETIPATRLIRVVNYYFSESTHKLQWLPDLILWEQLNHIAIETGVNGEYGGSPRWPCDYGPR